MTGMFERRVDAPAWVLPAMLIVLAACAAVALRAWGVL